MVATSTGNLISLQVHSPILPPYKFCLSILYSLCDIRLVWNCHFFTPIQFNALDEGNFLKTSVLSNVGCKLTRWQSHLLGECREVAVESMTNNVVDERQTFWKVFCRPVAEVQVQQTLITACINHRPISQQLISTFLPTSVTCKCFINWIQHSTDTSLNYQNSMYPLDFNSALENIAGSTLVWQLCLLHGSLQLFSFVFFLDIFARFRVVELTVSTIWYWTTQMKRHPLTQKSICRWRIIGWHPTEQKFASNVSTRVNQLSQVQRRNIC